MDPLSQYQSLLTDLIKKQIVMLGPNVTLAQARKVSGLTVADDGTVRAITADPQTVLNDLAGKFLALSGAIAQMTLESVISKYPGVKKPGI